MAEKVMYRGTGRRKSSTARVILRPGNGQILINNVEMLKYLKSGILVQDAKQPLVLTKNEESFNIIVNVKGGGISGQAGAIRLGIARALLQLDKENRSILKAAGMLTRDARVKERKKPGLRKARRAKQFSKR
jgi:small subunit ribosomal protein S9